MAIVVEVGDGAALGHEPLGERLLLERHVGDRSHRRNSRDQQEPANRHETSSCHFVPAGLVSFASIAATAAFASSATSGWAVASCATASVAA